MVSDLCKEVRDSPTMRVCVLDEGKVREFIKKLSEVESKVTSLISNDVINEVVAGFIEATGARLEGGFVAGDVGVISRSVVAIVDMAYNVMKLLFGLDGIKAYIALIPLIYASFSTALGVEEMVLEEPNEFGLFMLMYRAFRSDDVMKLRRVLRRKILKVVDGLGIRDDDLRLMAFVKVALSMLVLAVAMITELTKKDAVEILKGLLLYVKGRAFFEEEMIVDIPREYLLRM